MSNETTGKIHLAGLGLPLIDFITPTHAELENGAKLLKQLDPKPPSDLKGDALKDYIAAVENGPADLAKARSALTKCLLFFDQECRERGLGGGDKITLSEEEAKTVAALYEDILVAARHINFAAEHLGRPAERVQIRHMGGTLPNKFHAIQSALGDQVQTHMYGALGEEDESKNRARVVDEVRNKSGINFKEIPGVSLGLMAVSYILPVAGDRIAFKAPVDIKQALAPHQQEIADFAREVEPGIAPDYYFLEGTDYEKLGSETFETFANAAMESGKPIVFSPPTNKEPLKAEVREAMDRIIDHPNTVLMTMNEAEAVNMFCDQKLVKQPGQSLQSNGQLQEALKAIQTRLAQKREAQPPGAREPIAFVSVGKEGAYYVTAGGYQFVDNPEIVRPFSTIGAGDAFASGVFVEYLRMVAVLAQEGRGTFTNDELNTMALTGQKLGRATVCVKGAQLPPADISTLIGNISKDGALVEEIKSPKEQKAIG